MTKLVVACTCHSEPNLSSHVHLSFSRPGEVEQLISGPPGQLEVRLLCKELNSHFCKKRQSRRIVMQKLLRESFLIISCVLTSIVGPRWNIVTSRRYFRSRRRRVVILYAPMFLSAQSTATSWPVSPILFQRLDGQMKTTVHVPEEHAPTTTTFFPTKASAFIYSVLCRALPWNSSCNPT